MIAAAPRGVKKRSVMIAGHRTSVSLEQEFWDALQQIAVARGESVQALVCAADKTRDRQNLSSAIRVFVLQTLQTERSARRESDIRVDAEIDDLPV